MLRPRFPSGRNPALRDSTIELSRNGNKYIKIPFDCQRTKKNAIPIRV